MGSTISNEIQNLRYYLTLPPEQVPEDWRVFVAEYQRQKVDAERMAVSDDKGLARRGKLLLANLEKMT